MAATFYSSKNKSRVDILITYGELVRGVYLPTMIMTLSTSSIGVSKSCWDCLGDWFLGILARRDQELICKESRVDILMEQYMISIAT